MRALTSAGIELWCNGNTADFGSVVPSSSLGSSTQRPPASGKDSGGFFLPQFLRSVGLEIKLFENFAELRNVCIFAHQFGGKRCRFRRQRMSSGLKGLMAEWLGTALQKLLQRFESASDLTETALQIFVTLFYFLFVRHLYGTHRFANIGIDRIWLLNNFCSYVFISR